MWGWSDLDDPEDHPSGLPIWRDRLSLDWHSEPGGVSHTLDLFQDDIYESFRVYQKALLKEYASMGDEFGFRVLDARRKVDVIQDELRRQIAAFLVESDVPSLGGGGRAD